MTDDAMTGSGSPFESDIIVDRICDSFESAWKQGTTPDIARFLSDTDPNLRSTLFVELVKLDIHYREQSGESATLDDYSNRFPEHADSLEELIHLASTKLEEPKQLGRFRLDRVVGRGGFGIVWKAWDSKLQRAIAIKIPRKKDLTEADMRRFFLEAKSAARLKHPGIVAVHEYGQADGSPFIVTEFVNGLTLKAWCKQREVTPKLAAKICKEIAVALHSAHQDGVIHRDIKPTNILIDDEEHVHVTDFGLAKRVDVESTIGSDGAVFGTLAYMCPEQADGRGSDVNASSDVYSLGILLYEMLTNRVPFKGMSNEQMISQVLRAAPASPRKWNQTIPRDLETICLKAISKDPKDRYATAEALATDLEHFAQGEPIQARRISWGGKIWRWSKRNPKHCLAYAILLIALFSGAAAMYAMQDDGKWEVHVETDPPGAKILVHPRDPLSGEPDPTKVYSVSGVTPNSIRLPPGDYYVVAVLEGTNHFHHVLRQVPAIDAGIPVGSDNAHFWKKLGDRTLGWPKITIPEDHFKGNVDMILVPGDHSKNIVDLFVSRHLLTNREMISVAPYMSQKHIARKSLPDAPYHPKGQGAAIECAELSGGRLMTLGEYQHLRSALSTLPQNCELETVPTLLEWTSSEASIQQATDSEATTLPPEFWGVAVSFAPDSSVTIDSERTKKLGEGRFLAVRYSRDRSLALRVVRNAKTLITKPKGQGG